MGSEWQHLKLSEVAVFSYGKMPKKGKIGTGVYPTYSGYKYQYLYPEYNCDEGDLIVVARGVGGTGDVKLVNKRCYLTNLSIKINLDQSKIDNRYFYYFYLGAGLRHLDSGSAQSQITINDLGNVVLSVPPLQAQIKVVEILERLDNKITLNRQINTTLESMAQALFKSWFVDFDPVIDNALAAGNEIPDALQKRAAVRAARREALRQQTNKTTNKTTGATDAASSEQALPDTGLSDQRLPTEIQQRFPDRFVFTEDMGWVPEGWEVRPLNQFGQIVCGKTPSKSKPEFFGSDIPFIKIPDMHDNVFVVDPNEKLSNQGAKSQVKKMLPRGSVCVSCIATVGKVVITVEPSQTNQQINSIVPHSGFLTEYLYFYMQTLEKHFHDLASGGSATLNMNTTTFGKVEILSPDSKVLDFFHGFVERSFSQIELRMRQSLSLTQLRNSLLPKLLSGQITIPDAEQQLAEVL